jgi:hypothetical protein
MPTIDNTLGGSKGEAWSARGKFITFHNRVDFSVSGNAAAASDVVQLLDVPLGFLCLGCSVRVITAEGIADTATIGDGDDPNGYIASVDLNALGETHSSLALTEAAPPTFDDAYMGAGGKYYAAADTIDAVVSAITDGCVLEIVAWGFQLIPKVLQVVPTA